MRRLQMDISKYSQLAPTPPPDQPVSDQSPPVAAGVCLGGGPVVEWTGVLGVEGSATGDGRLIEFGALVWDTLPIPLRYAPVDNGGHDGAVAVGQITSIERGVDGVLAAAGFIDMEAPLGVEACRAVAKGLQDGVSMDLDEVSFEVRVSAESYQGSVEVDGEVASDGRIVVQRAVASDELMVTVGARVRAATLVSIPAFRQARIALVDAGVEGVAPGSTNAARDKTDITGSDGPVVSDVAHMSVEDVCNTRQTHSTHAADENLPTPPLDNTRNTQTAGARSAHSLQASGPIPHTPPAAWFTNPQLTQPTPLTVTPDGQVYGHLAAWGTCHISHTQSGCVTPPRSLANYAYFHTGTVIVSDGTQVPVGHITLDTNHAGERLSAAAASAHYENTGHVVADVTCGEDTHGIWVAGAMRSTASATQVKALRASPLSGDWRRLSGNLELVAALAVVVPGFPIPRPRGLVAGGVTRSLVASGMVAPRRVTPPGAVGSLSLDDLRYLKRLADRERVASASAGSVLARRVRASRLAVRVGRSVGGLGHGM